MELALRHLSTPTFLLGSLLVLGLAAGCTPEKKSAFQTPSAPTVAMNPPGPKTIRPDDGVLFKINLSFPSDGHSEVGKMTNTTWRIASSELTPSRTLQAGEDVGHLVILEFPTGSGESSCTYFAPKTIPAGSTKMKVTLRAEFTDSASGGKPTGDVEITVDPQAPPAAALPPEVLRGARPALAE